MTSRVRYVTSERDGWPLEEFLAAEFEELSVRTLRRLLLSGRVLVNREAGWLGRRLRSGEKVSLREEDVGRDERASGEVPAPTILYEDEAVVAVDKPPGIPVVPDRARNAPSLVEVLRERERGSSSAGEPSVWVVHRIDRDASGVVIFAKTRSAHRDLSLQFQRREVSKRYLALITGEPDADAGEIDLPIGHDPREKMRMRTDRREGKMSRTGYRVVERFRDFTLVEASPETGRTHQIRVHFAGVGHALAVDPMYGMRERLSMLEVKPGFRPKKGRRVRPMIERLTLHAAALVVRHPESGEPLEIQAPLPEDFSLVLKMLRKYRPPRRPDPA